LAAALDTRHAKFVKAPTSPISEEVSREYPALKLLHREPRTITVYHAMAVGTEKMEITELSLGARLE
jgi:hypothetical protein